MATLYMVATPIGNLQDITFRALEALKASDVIFCEDTRHTLKLLTHFGISKPLKTCHAARERQNAEHAVSILDRGETVAYASDAGTPCLSDPGAILAGLARERGHDVVPVPGASAFATLLSCAGPVGKSVTFEGFLSPRPGRRRKRLAELIARDEAFVLYESPHRILKTLDDIVSIDPEREVYLGRELTKLHEEKLRLSARELRELLGQRKEILGEIALVVLPSSAADEGEDGESGEG